jgi:hypothetical protein
MQLGERKMSSCRYSCGGLRPDCRGRSQENAHRSLNKSLKFVPASASTRRRKVAPLDSDVSYPEGNMFNWLTKFLLSAAGQKFPDEIDFEPAKKHTEVGIHVLSDFGEEYRFVSARITEKAVIEAVRSLDWRNEIQHVFCTISRGVSMEVSGSFYDGLSGVYFKGPENVRLVTSIPPQDVSEMTDLMVSFVRGDGKWRTKYGFN